MSKHESSLRPGSEHTIRVSPLFVVVEGISLECDRFKKAYCVCSLWLFCVFKMFVPSLLLETTRVPDKQVKRRSRGCVRRPQHTLPHPSAFRLSLSDNYCNSDVQLMRLWDKLLGFMSVLCSAFNKRHCCEAALQKNNFKHMN